MQSTLQLQHPKKAANTLQRPSSPYFPCPNPQAADRCKDVTVCA